MVETLRKSACCGCSIACLPTTFLLEHLSVGIVVYKSGVESDRSNCRGSTVCSVIAKLFAMILEQRIASWAIEHAVKAKGQADF